MDFRMFDRVRRASSPLEVEHVEAYAQGRISRREFVRRGSVIGLSMPFMGAVIAACGSSSGSKSSDTTTASGGATTTAGGAGSTAPGTTAASAGKAGGTLKITTQKPSAPLNPTKMADLGTYTIVTESFEYLCGKGEGTDLAPALAESWKPNATGDEWTFNLRKNVVWSDGSPFTADDVVASITRLMGGNLKANVASVRAADANTAVVTLTAADGQFPYFVSLWNAQSVMTPKSFTGEDTLDKKPVCTGAWVLDKFDPATGVTFKRNDKWWGGKTNLDSIEFIFSDDLATQISGLQGGQADAIVQYSVIGGEALQNDSNFTTVVVKGAAHRQLWMNTREGDFTDKRVRQAIALGLDRDALIKTLFRGNADLGNDHPVAPVFGALYDKSQTQRTRNVDKAKALLAEAGKSGLKTTMYAVKLQEIPELAQLIQTQLKEIGMDVQIETATTDTYLDNWCKVYDSKNEPAGCDGGKDFGIIDWGNRGWPDVYLVKSYATGEWNSAHYNSAPFNAAMKEYQSALESGTRSAAIKKVQAIANEDVPFAIPYFYPTQFAHSKKVSGITASGLGHFDVTKASLT